MRIKVLELENAILKRGLNKTSNFCDGTTANVNNLVSGSPKTSHQGPADLHSSTPFVVVLIDGDEKMVLFIRYENLLITDSKS